ncbi:MAG TPA: polyprenyl diphosphate synthase [Thermoplasmataceae archaeon]|nr:polyprenyl diphosphate synthase [Thermoplasmataceae archaeon]
MGITERIGTLASEVYEKVLMEEIKKSPLPGHLGIITDGNRRYARQAGIPENEGHVRGKDKLEEVLQWCMDLGIRIVTVYAFSTENFNRDSGEVDFLFRMINDAFIDLLNDERIFRNRINVRVIGDVSKLPDYLRETIKLTEETTKRHDKFRFNLAIGYSGRGEIINAIRAIAGLVKEGKLEPDDIDEEKFREYLYDGSLPDPDLILRTSGEERISNFLLWQSAYSELYFSDVNWPDLTRIDFLRAISAYQVRSRRFGT